MGAAADLSTLLVELEAVVLTVRDVIKAVKADEQVLNNPDSTPPKKQSLEQVLP
jgi:hypothetical protein